jgi:DNA-directed RNA polymerase specialized sigma24 family protein
MIEALRVTYDEGRSSDEAATLLSMNAAAFRKRLERARDALRLCLSKND